MPKEKELITARKKRKPTTASSASGSSLNAGTLNKGSANGSSDQPRKKIKTSAVLAAHGRSDTAGLAVDLLRSSLDSALPSASQNKKEKSRKQAGATSADRHVETLSRTKPQAALKDEPAQKKKGAKEQASASTLARDLLLGRSSSSSSRESTPSSLASGSARAPPQNKSISEAEARVSSAPLPTTLQPSRSAGLGDGETLDPPSLIRELRRAIKSLLATLATLEAEHTLVSQLWYKNRSQLRSAAWFSAFNGVRRHLRAILLCDGDDVLAGSLGAKVEKNKSWNDQSTSEKSDANADGDASGGSRTRRRLDPRPNRDPEPTGAHHKNDADVDADKGECAKSTRGVAQRASQDLVRVYALLHGDLQDDYNHDGNDDDDHDHDHDHDGGDGRQGLSVHGTDVGGQAGWPKLPKYANFPTSDTFHAALYRHSRTRSVLGRATDSLQELQWQLERLANVAFNAANFVLKHLNTPPAPTFAPIATACIATSANVYSLAQGLTVAATSTSTSNSSSSSSSSSTPAQASTRPALQTLTRVLDTLSSAANDRD
ncbi:hypothetical protein BCV70DRAFT_201658 [Testicularia cyperi]|uniref:Uncharacterized protein n=1 Tax=Testicularia cyperi TaxID=1882483 RepID=A0A317XM46_9BASI|nr:hypothetical protein BCV70DRAFT_201658 [Testicularia cyperi]